MLEGWVRSPSGGRSRVDEVLPIRGERFKGIGRLGVMRI